MDREYSLSSLHLLVMFTSQHNEGDMVESLAIEQIEHGYEVLSYTNSLKRNSMLTTVHV